MTQSILSNNNIENSTNETYFDTLLQNKNFSVDKRNVNFSKLVDNVSAKTNQVQTKFVSSAVKSNTSSINKKVLENKTQTKTTEKTTPKQKKLDFTSDVKKASNSNIQNKPSNNSVDLSSDKAKVQNTFVNKENTSNEFINDTDSAEISVNASTEENATETNNISSPVSSSPVIFFEADTQIVENSNIENDTDIEALDAIAMVNVVPEVKLYTVEDLSSEIDEFVSESQIDENTLNAIEKVASVVEQNNLSQQTNDNLQDLLEKLKQNIAQKADTTDDTNIKAEIKEVLNDVLSEVSQYSKTDETLDSQNLSAEVPATEVKVDIAEIKSDLIEIKNALEELVKDAKLQDKELGEVLDEINVVIENTDENTDISSEEFLDNIKNLKEKLEDLKQTISKTQDKEIKTSDNTTSKETKTKIDVDVNDSKVNKLSEKLSALQNKISDYVEDSTSTAKSTDLKNTDTKSDIDFSDKTKMQQADDSNQKLISEIVNILKSSENEVDSDEIVLDSQIEKSIVIPENTSKDTSSDTVETAQLTKEQNEFSQNSKNIQDDTLKTVRRDSDKNSSEDNKIALNRTIQQTDNFENTTADYDSEFSQNQDTDVLEVEIPEVDSETTNTQSDNKQDVADIFKKEKLDLIEDIKFGNDFSESGALSVSDEIAKIAMNTNSSTNLNNMHLGQNENLIKNISFEKTLQQSQNIQSKIESSNIFNQINEKLQNFATNNSQRLTMVLRPQDLGRLSIELMSNDKGLTTNILVQNADVRKYIEKNIDGLRQQLANAGVNVNTIQIKTAGESGSSTFEGNQNQSNQQNESDSAFKNNQNTNQDNQKRDKNEYLANADYDSFFSKNTNDDFSSVLNNTFNYMLN